MLKKTDVMKMIQTYFIKKIEAKGLDVDVVDTSAELIQLLDDLPTYDMCAVETTLEEKRYWDALRIVNGGWK